MFSEMGKFLKPYMLLLISAMLFLLQKVKLCLNLANLPYYWTCNFYNANYLGNKQIRRAREQRLTEEPVSGIKIIIRTCDGERMERLFKDTAFFQVREIDNT